MAKHTTTRVKTEIDRFHLLGRHVCSPDLRSTVGCPMLSILRCNALGSEKLTLGDEIPGFFPMAVLPHPMCPVSVEALGS